MIDATAQNARLVVFIQLEEVETEFEVRLVFQGDTVRSARCGNLEKFVFDELKPGDYIVYAKNAMALNGVSEFSCHVNVEDNKEYNCFLVGYTSAESWEFSNTDQKSSSSMERTEVQLALNFGNQNLQNISPYTSHFSIREEAYDWKPFNRHIGRLVGGGISFGQYFFRKDSSFFSGENQAIRKKYNAWDLDVKYFFRFSQRTQQFKTERSCGLILDIGLGYYLPFIFRQNTRYDHGLHVVQTRIHQFNDFRAIVNVGFYPVVLSAEYRINDFIGKNLSQLPRVEFGMKILISN